MRILHCLSLLPVVFVGLASEVLASDEPAQVYRGATVMTVSQGEITDADFVIEGGRFVAVGERGDVAIPAGAEVHHLEGKVVIPGLVDTHSHIGIFPRPAIEANMDGNEMTGAVQAGIRALDAIWPDDPGIRQALTGGVTTANIMPGSGNVIGGQTLYVKLRPGPITNMMVQPGTPEGGLKMANGENPKRVYGSRNQPPGTRMRSGGNAARTVRQGARLPPQVAALTARLCRKPRKAKRRRNPAARRAMPRPMSRPSPSTTWGSSHWSRCSIASGPSISIRIGPTTS